MNAIPQPERRMMDDAVRRRILDDEARWCARARTAEAEVDRLRARMARVAAWADRYDGEIAGTIRDALNLNEPHWSDNESRE